MGVIRDTFNALFKGKIFNTEINQYKLKEQYEEALETRSRTSAAIGSLEDIKEDKSNKSQPNGYPSLDADGKIPSTQIGDISGNSPTATKLITARKIGIATGDIESSGSDFDGSVDNSNVYAIKNNIITNEKLSDMPIKTFKGNKESITGNAQDLTIADAQTMIFSDNEHLPVSLAEKTQWNNSSSPVKIYDTVAEMQANNTSITVGMKINIKETGFYYNIEKSPVFGGINVILEDELYIKVGNLYAVLIIDSNVITEAKKRSNEKYNLGISKLKTRNPVQINCYGDSTTFGLGTDIVTAGLPTNFGDGSTYAHNQISDPYPKQLEQKLRTLVGNQITVKNLGYSGDRISNAYHRFVNTESSADFSIFMYGINDVQFCTNNGLDLQNLYDVNNENSLPNFYNDYKKMLVRQMLRGNNVIVGLPINFVSGYGFDGTQFSATRLVEEYRKATINICEELGIYYVDIASFYDNYDIFDITKDSLHPNVNGYNILASRLSSIFIGKGYKEPTKISGERIITATNFMESVDGNLSTGIVSVITTTETYTPHKFFYNSFKLVIDNDTITFPIYCEHDNTEFFVWGINSDVYLDYGVQQGAKSISYDEVQTPNVSSITLSGILDASARKKIIINNKGWHNVSIQGSGEFYALIFNKEYFKESIIVSDTEGTNHFIADKDKTYIKKRIEKGVNKPVIVEQTNQKYDNSSLVVPIYIDFSNLSASSYHSHTIEISVAMSRNTNGYSTNAKLLYSLKSFDVLSGLVILEEKISGGTVLASIVGGNRLKIQFTTTEVCQFVSCDVKCTSSFWDSVMNNVSFE